MKIIRPGLKTDEAIYECQKCKCQFLFSVNELIGVQAQGGYIACPECGEMAFIYFSKNMATILEEGK